MNSTGVKVSVVVPNYNYARYLDQRMDSILNQTFQDFEVIILDDKSTDNSLEVLEKYRNHPKLKEIVCNEKNTGSPCKQWKKGCDMAEGEYVWIAEADDFCDYTFLQKAVDALTANKDADLFFSGSYQNYEGKDEIIHRRFDRWSMPKYKLPEGETYYVIDGQFYRQNYLSFNNCIYNASGAVFRRTAADRQAWEYVDGFYSLGDWALWSYIIGKSKVVICPEPLNRFRMHPKSSTKKFSKEYASLMDGVKIIQRNTEGLPEMRRMVILMRYCRSHGSNMGHASRRKKVKRNLVNYFGKSYFRRAKMAFYFNKLLVVTPWHIGMTEGRRKRPI